MNPVDVVKRRLHCGRHWMKGDLGSPHGRSQSTCLVGAMLGTLTQAQIHTVVDLCQQVVTEQFPELWGVRKTPDIVCFNDHPDTRWSDIELVLDKASILWEEHHRSWEEITT